jgi:hypothetical protein
VAPAVAVERRPSRLSDGCGGGRKEGGKWIRWAKPTDLNLNREGTVAGRPSGAVVVAANSARASPRAQ